MKRSKKFVLMTILAAVVLIGGIGGSIALADEEDDVTSRPAAWCDGSVMDRVCEIYEDSTGTAIDRTELEKAFAEARSEACPDGWGGWQKRGEVDPEAMKTRLQELLDQGKINQEQFYAMQDRMETMPDGMPAFGFRGHGGMRGYGGFGFGFQPDS